KERNPLESKDEGRTPRPVAGIDMRKLPIGPQEAYVLTRVDGRSSETEIAASTGIDKDLVRESLGRLAELGAIEWTPPNAVVIDPRPVAEKSSVTPNAKLERPA